MFPPFTLFAVLLLGVVAMLLAIRLLHLASQGAAPMLQYTDSKFNREVLRLCPILSDMYIPTLLWGKSGHVQTLIYAKMGRINSPFPKGQRCSVSMPDGATTTYDVFEPHIPHPSGGDYTLLVCPGIANHSESVYIRTCVFYAQSQGFRVAVLNHLGALPSVPLTSPRIFTYGGTEDFGAMVDDIKLRYPASVFIAVGFSMGGNIVVKYFGEDPANQHKVLFILSCAQGYDIYGVMPYLSRWEHLRRIYLWAMTRNLIGHLKRNIDVLFGAEAQKSGPYDVARILSSTTMVDIDELYSRRQAGFPTLYEYYTHNSSKYYIDNIHIPVFLLNSMDDPLVPPELHTTARDFASKRDNVIFAATRHGGHLGFFEGGLIIPENITWLDRVVVQYTNAAIKVMGHSAE